jgi:NAD-dependent deacetylase
MPDAVWGWYLYRRGICRAAEPNAAHRALASLEATLGDRFCLVTQNVDGLHLRAGNTLERTYQIHGNLDFMRPVDGPGGPVLIPAEVGTKWAKNSWIDSRTRSLLTMPDGRATRPHILWFDESYDDNNYRVESAAALATKCSLLVVVGTTGNTNLPLHIGRVAAQRGVPILVINPEENPFSQMVSTGGVFHLPGTAGQWVPAVAERLDELAGDGDSGDGDSGDADSG